MLLKEINKVNLGVWHKGMMDTADLDKKLLKLNQGYDSFMNRQIQFNKKK